MLLRRIQDTEEDAELIRTLALAAFATPRALEGEQPADAPSQRRNALFREKVRHLVRSDPDGSWIAEADEGGRSTPVGMAQSAVREGTWGLGALAVLPEAQRHGVGRALLERAVGYGRSCLRGLICSSAHPAAARSYHSAGFALHPSVRLAGTLTERGRAQLPAPDGVVEATAKDRDLMDSVDRLVRGGAHGVDHELLLRSHTSFVVDDFAGSGYCHVDPERARVELLAATSRRLAARLLAAALLSLPADSTVCVPHLTAEQQWAFDIGLLAELPLEPEGFLCVRGMRPPAPYVASGAFL